MNIEEIAQDIIAQNSKSHFKWIMDYEGQILKDLDVIEAQKANSKRQASDRFSSVNDQVGEMDNYSNYSDEDY